MVNRNLTGFAIC